MTAPLIFWTIFTAAAVVVAALTAVIAYRKSRRDR
ncbi:hypothetical protein M2388_001465 [Leucobacter aridicollis]|uniref:Uncharacterized protein n=1 Tax=Leucobacter aridicollis TaxID=283878 RepID=A0A852RES1_9MICO|nr:hypothetical protein [Leucobacter aridicollis]NYD27360.1 hypothetical protein [Leucobacter aridicollis]